MDDHSEVLQNFMAITGTDDDAKAVQTLEATDWNLEQAVNLFFAAGGDVGAGVGGAGGLGGVAAGSPAPDGFMENDEVRAPLPTRTERLYGDPGGYMPPGARFAGLHGFAVQPNAAAAAAAAAATRPGTNHVDAFRDFKAEEASSSSAAAGGGGAAGLSGLFKPPDKLMFKGNFEQAKAAAADGTGRWLMVNVQSGSEFASHRLNRDTWHHPLVQDMVGGSFVFYQVYDTAPDGHAIMGLYHLAEVPTTLIVDPLTGGKMWERGGFIEPDLLVEELVPFLDAGPSDPGAARLAQASAARPKRTPGARAPLTEDEQLAAAIAASMEGGAGKRQRDSSAAGTEPEDGSDADLEYADAEEEAAIWAEIERRQKAEAVAAAAGGGTAASAAAPPPAAARATDPAAAQAEATARLPPELEGAGSCRVALRLPDGQRSQRRFPADAPVSVLFDFARSACLEAAGGRGFDLREPMPGAQALTEESSKSIQEAGVANAMLVLSWRDSST